MWQPREIPLKRKQYHLFELELSKGGCYLENDINVCQNIDTTINEDLASCAARNRWTRASINELLSLLRIHGHTDLRKVTRTLLQTPRSIETEIKCGGQYVYLGIEEGIVQKLIDSVCIDSSCLELVINIDGLPLYLYINYTVANPLLF